MTKMSSGSHAHLGDNNVVWTESPPRWTAQQLHRGAWRHNGKGNGWGTVQEYRIGRQWVSDMGHVVSVC
jgi:hypothetical protein